MLYYYFMSDAHYIEARSILECKLQLGAVEFHLVAKQLVSLQGSEIVPRSTINASVNDKVNRLEIRQSDNTFESIL